MRSTIINLAAMAGVAAAAAPPYLNAYPTTCTVPTLTYGGNVATITQTFTSTYCPICPQVVTTYTTEYDAFCPTGLQGNVYTVTETCKPDKCRTGVPPGFVTSVGVCNVCGPTPVTATLTQPATTGSYATVVQNYPVVYQTFGPSGLVPNTYTVTQSCAAVPCPSPVNNAPAPGFATTVAVCSTCGPTPITATLTVPTQAAAVGTGAAAAAAPGGSAAQAAPAGNAPAAAPAAAPAGGAAQAAPAGNAPAAAPAGSAAQAAPAGNAAAAPAGSAAQAAPAGNAAAAPAGNAAAAGTTKANTPAPYMGAASSNNAGSYLAAGLAGVAAVAQLL